MAPDREQLANKLFEFVQSNEEGYAIFDANDHLLYCNQSYGQILGFDAGVLIGRTFLDIISLCFNSDKGFKTDTDDLDVLLARISTQWRSNNYRLFEMQSHDDRWFLFSEIKNDRGEILIQTKQVTEQKVLEQKLLESRDNLRQLALTDELTGVANRRCFVDSVEAELHRCRRHNYQVAYMILDLDFFKGINDNYGHQAGDLVLQAVAKRVKKMLRDYDIFGRIGGEEFAVFLGRTKVEEVLLVAERIREAIADNPLLYRGNSIAMTTSIGISLCTSVAHTYQDLYNQADQALYQAKANGRNMCQFYREEHEQK
ncbi:sensor domain-containing diguanylate cyclase [Thalassomonas actiniarum]|uniref:Diguanylate cyclase n=1 Tax=Thalassomonas actiniarum TaxID=485447 RepID=A0AAE9YTB6_9GAMM|nr:sensor domain-containing diguanylate cyclase [Thalassomonas actiniarum]WDE00726.1 diguanylate cyclase [Thalassomonas actiniarum]